MALRSLQPPLEIWKNNFFFLGFGYVFTAVIYFVFFCCFFEATCWVDLWRLKMEGCPVTGNVESALENDF